MTNEQLVQLACPHGWFLVADDLQRKLWNYSCGSSREIRVFKSTLSFGT